MKFDGFIGPAYREASPIAGSSTAVNLILEYSEPRKQFVLYSRPGLSEFETRFSGGPCGALFAGDHRLFTVMGSHLYEVFDTGGGPPTLIGDVGSSSDEATIVVNGSQLLVVNGGKAFIDTGTVFVRAKETLALGTVDTAGTAITWVSGDDFTGINPGDTITIGSQDYTDLPTVFLVASVTDSTHLVTTVSAGTNSGVDFGIYREFAAATCTFLDGYFIVGVPNSKAWRWSALNDGKSWDPLDTENKEGYPDNLARVLAHDRRLWLFGYQTTEVWENSGNPPPASPFSRVSFIPQGCPAPWCPAEVGPTSVMWLSASDQGGNVVMRADSIQPLRVSTHALEYAIAQYATVNDAEGYSTQFRGHYLFVLTFPSAGETWVYDLTASSRAGEPIWTRYAGFINGAYTRYKGRVHAFVQGWNNGAGRHLLGDPVDGTIWEESPIRLRDGTEVIRVERTSPMLMEENKRITIWRMELILQTGTISTGDYLLLVEWSFDEGETFGNTHEISAGQLGQYAKRALLRQCGAGRKPVLRISSTSEVAHCWTDVVLRAELNDS